MIRNKDSAREDWYFRCTKCKKKWSLSKYCSVRIISYWWQILDLKNDKENKTLCTRCEKDVDNFKKWLK